MAPSKRRYGAPYNYDEAALHYEDHSEVPPAIKKYWFQRYKLFSRYDEGIWLTRDAWFGITPEPVAQKIAQHLAQAAPAKKRILIDAFAGAGGNTIAFALSGRWESIFAVEKDPDVLACAKHNAEIYGVANKIWWVQEDIFKALKGRLHSTLNEAVIFASPPWGGPDYQDDEVFDLGTMQPYGLDKLHKAMSLITKDVVMYLPRTSNLNQLARYGDQRDIQVIHYCMDGASKALCAFYGNFGSINK